MLIEKIEKEIPEVKLNGSREKRLQKSIESLEKQIEIHEEKKKIAGEQKNEELVKYYKKEIASLGIRKKNREEKRDRKKIKI